jgi:hypothetical protein
MEVDRYSTRRAKLGVRSSLLATGSGVSSVVSPSEEMHGRGEK